MRTKFENGILSFNEMPNEKVFCVMGTIFGDGDRFVRLMTEEEINQDGSMQNDGWSKKLEELEVGDSSTYGYWYYQKANIVTRLA